MSEETVPTAGQTRCIFCGVTCPIRSAEEIMALDPAILYRSLREGSEVIYSESDPTSGACFSCMLDAMDARDCAMSLHIENTFNVLVAQVTEALAEAAGLLEDDPYKERFGLDMAVAHICQLLSQLRRHNDLVRAIVRASEAEETTSCPP